MTLTWDPNNNNGMILSNGNLTASSPDNGTDSYVWDYATQPIAAGEKVFFQIDVSGGNGRDPGMAGGPGTGFDAGFAAYGFSPTLIDDSGDPNNGAPFGNTIVSSTYPSSADGFTSGYDGGLNLGGYLVQEVHRGVSEWGDPSYVDYALDRTTNKFWVYSSTTGEWNDDPNANPATDTGGYDISPVGNQTLYAIVGTLQVGNSSATLVNQDSDIQGSVPAGFTTLQDLGSGSSSSSSPPAASSPSSSGSSSSNSSSGGSSSSNSSSSGSSSSTPAAPTGSGGDTVTVNQPSPLTVGQITITGNESDPSQPVYLAWHTLGTPDSISEHDVVQATVDPNTGNFYAPVTIDTPGTQSTLFYSTGGAFSAAFSGTPSDGSSTSTASASSGSASASGSTGFGGSSGAVTSTTASSSGGSSSGSSGSSGSAGSSDSSGSAGSSGSSNSGSSSTVTADGVTVNVPTPFETGDITFTGFDSNADKTLHLDWHTYGTPALGDHDDVPVAVNSDGTFSATVTIDTPGAASTLFVSTGGSFVPLFTATPTNSAFG